MQPTSIVAVDGSPTSKAAVEWAAHDAGLRHAPLEPVHVLPNPVVGMWPEPPSSEQATAIAVDEASQRGVGLIALHYGADSGSFDVPEDEWEDRLEIGRETLAERLAGWQERCPDVSIDRRLVHGDPAAKLVAASESAQLTVVGSHGRGGFTGMLLGSVSSAVVQTARSPVIVARS